MRPFPGGQVSEEMSRVLAIDYGEKSVGIAISDELQLTSRPLTTLRRRRGEYQQLLDDIQNLIDQHEIETILVGLPLNMDGSRGPAASRTMRFIADLKRQISQPVLPVDERLTSHEADRILRQQGANQRQRRKLSDETAAMIILQDYLSRK